MAERMSPCDARGFTCNLVYKNQTEQFQALELGLLQQIPENMWPFVDGSSRNKKLSYSTLIPITNVIKL
jgi:hypothetical protein